MTQPPGYYPPPGEPYGQPITGPPDYPAHGYPQPGYPQHGFPQPGFPQPGYDPNYPPPAYPGGGGYDPGVQVTGVPNPWAGPSYPPPPKRRHTGLIITLVALGALLLLCVPGAGLAYYLYSKAGPTGAVESFLSAVFKDKDIDAAEDLVCDEEKGFGRDAIEGMEEAEDEYEDIEVTWEDIEEESKRGKRAEVSFRLSLKAVDRESGKLETARNRVTFVVVDEDGWKVCGEADDEEDPG